MSDGPTEHGLRQEHYVQRLIKSAQDHLTNANEAASAMPEYWVSDFYPLASTVGRAAFDALSALVNIVDLAARENEYLVEQLWDNDEKDIARLAEMAQQKVTHRCDDPECGHGHHRN